MECIKNNYGKENFEGFAYLDYDNPTVSWNIARGTFSTPTTLSEFHEGHQFLTAMMAGMLSETGFKRSNLSLGFGNQIIGVDILQISIYLMSVFQPIAQPELIPIGSVKLLMLTAN